MKIQHQPPSTNGVFSTEEQAALRSVSDRLYRAEIFGSRELAHLRFLRWLRETGKLAS